MTTDTQEIDNLLQQLKSPSSFKRISALEKIFAQNNLSKHVVQVLTAMGENDPDPNVRRYINSVQEEIKLAQEKIKLAQEKIRVTQLKEKLKENFITTTTSFIEGKKVSKYMGVISAEVVLGTGFLSEISAGVADLFGNRSTAFQNKFREAKDIAMEEIISQAILLDAEALIGIALDYTSLSNNVFVLCISGTAVRFETA